MKMNLTIDDDLVELVERLAERQNRTTGEVVSDMLRISTERSPTGRTRNGIPILPTTPGSKPTTLEIVNALRDDDP
jgi:hypothetical protein